MGMWWEIWSCASSLGSSLRSCTQKIAWGDGGEEFLAILPGQDLSKAYRTAERIRAAISAQRFAERADLHVTCSVGVATYPQIASDFDQLLNRADQALYVAKHLGRNHTYLAEPSKETSGGEG